jgi:hypothetical protein
MAWPQIAFGQSSAFLHHSIPHGRLFIPWTLANSQAITSGREEFSVELAGKTWTQKPQKYHAKSLSALREKYAALSDKSAIDAVLQKTGCLGALRG